MYRILIVDDEPLMRQALKSMISKIKGFEVAFSVGSGEQAVEICKNNKIDIVFMDIMLPGETGIEASKRIYSNNSKIDIYIISSYNSFDCAIEALNSNVKSYISKPVSHFQIEELLNAFKNQNKKVTEKVGLINMEHLFSIIKEKDFKKVYYEIPKIIDEIYSSKSIETDELKNYFIDIGQKLINSYDLFEEISPKIDDLFPINDRLVNNIKFYEFWLYKIINYIFQQNSIRKYDLLDNVFEYIEKHIEEEIGLNEIITNCSVSQGYLSRIFKRQFNISVMEYLHMRKIYIAKSYFCFTDLTITDVSFKLGYNESSYFSKVFKKYENTTIYQYKKML